MAKVKIKFYELILSIYIVSIESFEKKFNASFSLFVDKLVHDMFFYYLFLNYFKILEVMTNFCSIFGVSVSACINQEKVLHDLSVFVSLIFFHKSYKIFKFLKEPFLISLVLVTKVIHLRPDYFLLHMNIHILNEKAIIAMRDSINIARISFYLNRNFGCHTLKFQIISIGM